MDAASAPGHAALTAEEREALAGLRATIDYAPIGIAHFGVDGTFLLVNARLCEILGFTREELLARTFQEITFPDDLEHCLSLTAQLAAGSIPNYRVEKRFVRADHATVWTRITVSVVRGSDGRPVFFIGAAEDISEQIAAREAQQRAEQRLRSALSASLVGAFQFDVRRNALEWADGLARLFGGGQQHTLEDFFEVIHPEDRSRVMAGYVTSVHEGVDFELDFRVVWPDGSVHWLHDRGEVITGADGLPQYIVGAITDITSHVTERAAAEQKLAQLLERERDARRQAEQATKMREQVLAFVAHDLRNPVQTIVMAAGSLMELPLTEEQRARQLEIIRRSAWRIERLIGDLLDMSRMEAGTFGIREERVLVPALLGEIVESFESDARARGVSLLPDIDERVPPLKGDRQRLVQVLNNLVNNALKFTASGGRVILRAQQCGLQVQISVEDSGCGIAPENMTSIFERFWQADRTGGGAGLGLVIARGIVEAHGGEISVESILGRGTIFHVRLPLSDRERRRPLSPTGR